MTKKPTTKKPGKWERNEGYRKDFFNRNKGLLGGWLYFCVYCGRPITRSKLEVDHHIAINYVKHNPLLKIYFGIGNIISNFIGFLAHGSKWKKNKGVNVSYNLVPACRKCNRAKSDKGGLWIIRGMIGGTIWKACNFVNNVLIGLFTRPVGWVALAAGALGFLLLTPQGSVILSFLSL